MALELLSTTDGQVFSMEKERRHLLESISHETNRLALRNLRMKYNELVDLQADRYRGGLLDPIEYFPPEIWLQIFGEVGSSGKDDDRSNPIDHLLIASLVSARWRDAILNTHEIWTEITVDLVPNSWEEELFKLHTTMYLSGERPLTLTLWPSSCYQWEGERGMLQVILSHRSRIQRISFAGNWTFTHPERVVDKMLLSLCTLPQLQVIHVVKALVWSLLSWDDLISNAPALVSINIVVPSELLEGDLIKSFRRISISQQLDRIVPHLLKPQQLTSLSCWGGASHTLPPLPRQSFVNFGDLEEFNYYQGGLQPVLSLLQVTFKLTTLSIDIGPNWNILTPLMEVCHLLRFLFDLDLRLADPLVPISNGISQPAGPLAVRSLVIKYFPSITLPEKRSILLGCRHIADLVDVLDLCTPAVKEFYFYAGLMDYVPFKYVSSRGRLFRLTLSLPTLTSIPDGMLIQSKSVLCLNLKINTILVSRFFLGLDCPNLHHILFLADDKYDRSLSSPIANFDPATLPQLESIEWRNRPVFWQITSLQALRKLILEAWSREMISELLLHFIMRPDDCPSLDYIEFGANPEWDLLFMMLERRNHTTRNGVSRITTLVFPSGIPYSLLVATTELLNGRFTIGISYHDVSISSIGELYFDRKITGCASCLFSLHSCSSGVMIRKGRFVRRRHKSKYPTPPAANPSLSGEMCGWIDGREERDHDWDAKYTRWQQQRTSRLAFCHDPILSKRMVVTELTLKGVHL